MILSKMQGLKYGTSSGVWITRRDPQISGRGDSYAKVPQIFKHTMMQQGVSRCFLF